MVEVHGALVIDKAKGMTSFSAMRLAQRALRQKTAGHAGTLDPMATGVLVVLLGEATKLSNLLMDHDKVYEAEVTLGVATDTLDAEGAVTAEAPVPALTEAAIGAALTGFVGHHTQVPPRYSALKKDGKTHMSRARAGEDFEVEARPSVCFGLDLLAYHPGDRPRLCLRVHCGKGYYVRSLARDLGVALGTVAHLSALRRTRVGAFSITQAVEPTSADVSHLVPIPDCVPQLTRIVASGRLLDDLRCGRTTFIPIQPGSAPTSVEQTLEPGSTTALALTPEGAPVALVTSQATGDGRLRIKVARGFAFGPAA